MLWVVPNSCSITLAWQYQAEARFEYKTSTRQIILITNRNNLNWRSKLSPEHSISLARDGCEGCPKTYYVKSASPWVKRRVGIVSILTFSTSIRANISVPIPNQTSILMYVWHRCRVIKGSMIMLLVLLTTFSNIEYLRCVYFNLFSTTSAASTDVGISNTIHLMTTRYDMLWRIPVWPPSFLCLAELAWLHFCNNR